MNEPSGRALGGLARMEGTTGKERTALAKKAAAARWSGDIKVATHGSDDHPLKIGGVEIPCYVLEDETRVLSQRGVVVSGLGIQYSGGASRSGADRLTYFLQGKGISPFVSSELLALVGNPFKFRHSGGGGIAWGYPATILADLCDVVLAARKAGALQKQQEHIADRCEVLLRGFARVGIIALVDEATGYQRDRTRDALARILEAFVAKELQPWVKTFPDEYYAQMFRLRGLEYRADSVKRPQYFGTLTNDVVWKRLAPGVLLELKKVIPKYESGRRKGTLAQGLTRNIGYPKLREHLGAVVAYMTMSRDYFDFIEKLDQFHPRFGEQYKLPFDYYPDQDDGKGL
jgi:P63C domain